MEKIDAFRKQLSTEVYTEQIFYLEYSLVKHYRSRCICYSICNFKKSLQSFYPIIPSSIQRLLIYYYYNGINSCSLKKYYVIKPSHYILNLIVQCIFCNSCQELSILNTYYYYPIYGPIYISFYYTEEHIYEIWIQYKMICFHCHIEKPILPLSFKEEIVESVQERNTRYNMVLYNGLQSIFQFKLCEPFLIHKIVQYIKE